MKQISYLVLILLIPLISSYVCQDNTDDDNLPCQVITPLIAALCDAGNYNASVLCTNDTLINRTGIIMTPVGDGTYNFTFGNITNETIIGYSYSIVICDNSTSTLNIVQDEDPDINLWIVIFATFLALFIFGIIYHNHAYIGDILLFASGAEVLIAGIWVFQSGISIYGINQFWVYPFAWILVGIGIILVIFSSIDMIRKEESD